MLRILHRSPVLRPLLIALAAALVVPLAGCASSGNKKKSDTRYVARDVDTLYNAAKDRLDRRQYKIAGALFDEVERQHPYSVWARRAELMSAFSYYLARDYNDSIQSAQRFLSIHPGNRDAPYALYIIAVGYYEQVQDVTRDQKTTQQALDALGELIRRYPDSAYAADARLKVDLVRDHLAGKEMEIGRFYQRRRDWIASVLRFRKVVDVYQTSSHTPEALERLTESYLALGVRDEAFKAAAVLGSNYPGSKWYEHAYKLAQKYPDNVQGPARNLTVPLPTIKPPKPKKAKKEKAEKPDKHERGHKDKLPPANALPPPTDTPATDDATPPPTAAQPAPAAPASPAPAPDAAAPPAVPNAPQ